MERMQRSPTQVRDATAHPTVALCGDSTMAAYAVDQPFRGWGQFLGVYSQPHTAIANLARCGASTKTFCSLGLWQAALEQRPRWMLIQFGHNDSHHPDRPESTASNGLYREILQRMVDEARAQEATPILITPVCRRTWASDSSLLDTLEPYAEVTRQVAAAMHCHLIDLHRRSYAEYLRMGRQMTDTWSPEAHDFTHFTAAAARHVASWVAAELPENYPHGTHEAAAPPEPTGRAAIMTPEGH